MKNSFLVPIVFIFNFCLWLFFLSFFGGIRIFLLFGNKRSYSFIYAFLHYAYIILPIICTLSIFSVFVFLMRHKSKLFLSYFFLILIFLLFFLLIIPAIYSQGEKIETKFEIYKSEFTSDSGLAEFIETPFFVKTVFNLTKPICNDIYNSYKNGYVSYLILAGAFFITMFSLYGCITYTTWKIINFTLLPFCSSIILYIYTYLSNSIFQEQIKTYIPFHIQDILIPPIGLILISFLLNIFTVLLFTLKKLKQDNYE